MHDPSVPEFPQEQDAQSPAPALSKEEKIAQEREKLERRLANGELDDVRTRVAYVMNQYPTTRNSDVDLAIRYWKLFHGDDVGYESITYNALRIVTPMNSITRARATIQNTFKLFVPDDKVTDFRAEREAMVRGKQRAVRSTVPLVQVYSDESGKTEKHYVVGSLWVNDADQQSFKLFNDMNDWRKKVEWTSEIHFVDITNQRKENYLDFFRTAMQASSYIGFKAVVLARDDVKKRPTEDAIFNLYYRLVVDGVRHEVESGRFTLPRSVVVHKDEDEGTDKLMLHSLREKLRVECPKQFDNQVEIGSVVSVKSSSNVLMQLADLFTGSVNRIVNRAADASRNQKDYVAENVLELVGADPDNIEGETSGDFVRIIRL